MRLSKDWQGRLLREVTDGALPGRGHSTVPPCPTSPFLNAETGNGSTSMRLVLCQNQVKDLAVPSPVCSISLKGKLIRTQGPDNSAVALLPALHQRQGFPPQLAYEEQIKATCFFFFIIIALYYHNSSYFMTQVTATPLKAPAG